MCLTSTDSSTVKPYVEFPPAFPTEALLSPICAHGTHRLRYPRDYFPRLWFTYLRRRGSAIDRLESWFSGCCAAQSTQGINLTLCCAQQAWKQALSTFCEEEQSVMTAAFFCCAEEEEEAKWTCFSREPTPNPDYSPTEGYTAPIQTPEQGFTFSPNDCQI
ncbi:hypothetical protein NHX12_024107 [Muraenolepis orangiensis]|uniref:Extracellular matrix protein 1 n=1 Tax=Muraenolepis orangiensis TaxID=630683 RepID=A0A9Q0ES66_9TELE|nr:hypothetical protein NHX12_024107 [Muraenolepis orangiensis]